jgi:hypothetical protein
MLFPRELSCDVQSALCSALGYLEHCAEEESSSDKVLGCLRAVEQQLKRALESEMKLFKAIGGDKLPSIQ